MGLFGDHGEHHGKIQAVFGSSLAAIMIETYPELASRNVFP